LTSLHKTAFPQHIYSEMEFENPSYKDGKHIAWN
ncbi:hypothetical protein M084_5099, partial [Bacteroides fragilis str. 3988 T1]